MKRVMIHLARQDASDGRVTGWEVTSPRNNAIIEDDAPVHVSCRFFVDGAREIRLLVEDDARKESVEMVVPMGSAVGTDGAAPESSSPHVDVSFVLPANAGRASIAVAIDGQTRPAFDLAMATVFKVQRGGGGHLFLDNDTNRSVEQFTGAMLLSEGQREAWVAYARLAARLDAAGQVFRLLICPAKEEVFQDLYGHPRAALTPLDQVLSICAGPQLLFPMDLLREERELAYSKVDTHWSDYGARIGAIAFLRSVGLERAVDSLPTSFFPRNVYGDLGGKIDGGQPGVFMTLSREYPFLVPGFDNGIGNHGRIWTFCNNDAPVSESLVIFGDSYSVPLSAILAVAFSRVVYCYTAAGVDPEILAAERPRYTLAQTNQRFVINAPGVDVSIFRQIAQKLHALSATERESMRERLAGECPEPTYRRCMEELLQ